MTRGLENYIPDPTQLLPSHLYHELLFGETTDTHEPVTIKTISGRETEHDDTIATYFLQAEHNLTFSFSHSPQILRDTAFYSGAAPTNVKLRDTAEVPSVGILCVGYIGALHDTVEYPVPVSLSLQYAINICEALVEVHQRMMVHRNVNPLSIIMHENGEAHLNGFHLSYNCVTDSSFEVDILLKDQTLSHDPPHKNTPVFSGGVECLQYISPEHTGRVHNKPDPRSDLYCLGVVIYEMLTGTLPFQFDDPLEMMHAHIARPPPPLPEHLSSLGDIVHILLAKDPDQRYSTPLGLKADLITCRDMIFKYGKIKPFPLRKKDLIANPRLFGGLLGRQKEVALITNVIKKIDESSSVLLISGSAGVGKTALVNALLKDIQEKGMYGTGKFDEYIATTSFFGVITSSIKNLFSQSISRCNSDIHEWKKKLRQVIAGCEKTFLDMFPQMEMYVEAPFDAEQLPPVERKYRMHTMIADLVAMLSAIAPVILFFDDLQWADPASLELIEVISNASETNILIIGTYREFNTELQARVDSMKATKRDKCACLDLQPFDENAVLDLLCESLQDDRDHLHDLAKVIHAKTMGNTLFVIQFLAILYRRSLVYFDWDLQKWVWDMTKIEEIGYTDGLVTFFRNIFHDLQAESLNLLTFASLLGNRFNVKVLSHFAQSFNFPGVSAALIEATKTGFIIYLGKDEYSFIHDKIRQSAYELSSDQLKQRVYYEVGIYLLNSDDEDSSASSLLYLKHVYPKLLANANSEEGKKNLRKATSLALKAGIASKTASAYPSALDYLKLGCNMLIPKDWEQENTVAFKLTLALAECMFLCGFQEEALREFSKLLGMPLTIAQKVLVYQTEMHVLSSTVNYSEGIKVGKACLSLLGFEVRSEEENIKTCDKLIRSMDLQKIYHMPALTDTNLSLLMDMMGSLIMIAFFADKSLFMLVASEMVRITLNHGPSPSCPTGLVFFASYYGTVYAEPIKAYQLGKLAVDLHTRFPVNSVKSKAQFLFTFVNPWSNHFSDNFRYLRTALQTAQAAGDYLYKGYATGHIPNTMLWVGSHAREILAEARALNKNLQKKEKYKDILLLCDLAVGFSSLLLGETISEDSLTTLDGTVNEDDYLLDKKNGILVDNWYLGEKIEALYLFGLYKEANELSVYYLSIVGSLVGHPHEPRGVAYSILSLLAAFPSGTEKEESANSRAPEERAELLAKTADLRKHMRVWVKYSSQNFLHYDLLIDAETARVKGSVQTALMLYDRAAAQARSTSYFYIEALAHELAARVLEEVGMVSFAELSVKKALEGYGNWGAVQKVKQLTRKFSHLLPSYAAMPENCASPSLRNADEEVLHAKTRELDMRTIIKANHVLSKEIALPQLLQKFVNIVLENVGAEQAAIVLVDQNSSWCVASSWSVHDQYSKKKTGMSMEGARKNIVDYVLHTKRPLAIDAFKKSDFYDPLQGMEIGSVLCVPIGLKGLVCGAVYLEHTVPRVLQQDRLELMSLLCTQLYISIDNANLYNSIQSSEHRYKTMAEGLPIMAFSRNSSGNTFANSKLLQFFGLASDRAESVVLDEVVERIHPEDTEIFMDAWNSAVDPSSSPVEVEMRMRRASDGDFRWTLCHVTPCFDSLNRAEMLMGTWMDIQELKDAQAEQIHKAEIEASEQKYRSLAEAIPQIVWKSPQDGQVNYFNRRWYEYTGLTEEESLGEGYMVAFHPEDVGSWPLHLDIHDDFEVKVRIRRRDGVYRWHLARAILTTGKKFGTFTDIEDQAQTEASLEVARKTAEKAAHNQAFFVANMSHEIRTPMNGLLGMLHLLLETDLSEEQRDYSDTMKRSADSLLRIIDDVLDFSKIQEGKLELRDELIGVEAILEDVIETLSILAVSVELLFSVHRDVPAKLIGDSGKLRQIIMNLVGNSVKFTPSGGVIFVSCVVKERQGENVLLKFEVSDTGEGIGLEKQKMLFTPFYQADSSSTRAHGGTGLGLAICKQLVTLFHGEIGVTSTMGKGSTFTFTASFKISPDQPDPPPPFPAHWRALLVSNFPHSLTMLENHLQTCKIPYVTANSQEAAMEILREEKEKLVTPGISCVILDLFAHLEMDAEFQKCKPYLENKHVVLVVTSQQRPKLLREFSEASCLLKPVTLHKFVEALLDRSTQCKGKLAFSSDKFQYKGTSQVLVVEDNKVNQKVLASFLTKYHVPFSMANNGLEAFQMVKEKPFGFFSLILLDLAMPIWDGYRACTEIRNLENGAYRHPIVALTANVQDGILANCRECGMDDFISKPVDFKQLFAMLDKYLSPHEEPN